MPHDGFAWKQNGHMFLNMHASQSEMLGYFIAALQMRFYCVTCSQMTSTKPAKWQNTTS